MAKGAYIGIETEIPIYDTETVNVTADNIGTVFTVNNGSYYFAGSGDTFTTNNSGVSSSTATTKLTAVKDMDVSFSYSYSSESGYDKFTLKIAGTTVENAVSGSTTRKTWSGSLVTGQTIEFTYKKDGSVNNYDDKCTFSAMTCVSKTQTGTTTKNFARKIKKGYIGISNFTKRTLPSGYTQVEYLESNGTQYIDTGFKHNQYTRICMDIQLMSDSETAWAFGGRMSNTNGTMGVFWYTSNSAWNADYNGNSERYAFSSLNAFDRLNIDYNQNILTINGETSNFTPQTFSNRASLALLAVNTNGTVSGKISARLYSCKIYDNGKLIRDYVPCVSPSGVAGLFDLAGYGFYINDGTGTFAIGGTYADIARKIKKAYIGIGGVARPCFSDGELTYYGQVTSFSRSRDLSTTGAVGQYVIFGADFTYSPAKDVTAYDENFTRSTPSAMQYTQYSAATANATDDYLYITGGWYSSYSGYLSSFNSNLTYTYLGYIGNTQYGIGGASTGDYAVFAGGRESSDAYLKTAYAYDANGTKHMLSSLSYNYTGTSSNPGGQRHGNCAVFCSSGSKLVTAYNNELMQLSYPSLASSGSCYSSAAGEYIVLPSNQTAYDVNHTLVSCEGFTNKDKEACASAGSFAVFATGSVSNDIDDVDVYDENLIKTNDLRISQRRSEAAGVSYLHKPAALIGGGRTEASTTGSSDYSYRSEVDAFVVI